MIKPLNLMLDSRTRFVPLNPDNFHRFDFERVTVRQLLASIDFRDENITNPGKDKIEIVIGNTRIYIGFPFAYGNGKLSSSIAISALLPLVTCEKGLDCRGTCYAKDCLNRPSCWNKRLIYTWLVFHYMDFYFDCVREQLNNLPPRVNTVRLHESGDFKFQAYVDSWVKVCEDYPELTFYYYTKSNCDLSVLENLENVVSNSSIYQKRKNYGDDAYCQNLYDFISLDEHYRVKICPCNPDDKLPDGEANKICGKSCTFCSEKVEGKQNFPIFRGHGKAFEEAKKKRKKEKKNKKRKAA